MPASNPGVVRAGTFSSQDKDKNKDDVMLFRRLILCAVVIGIAAGVLLGLTEQTTTAPIIAAAEQYEHAGHAHEGHGHHHVAAWAPDNGAERVVFTIIAGVGVAIGFALMLLVAMCMARVLHGHRPTMRAGLLWGLGAFACVFAAPAIGLPPELPGAAAADLTARQIWWVAAVGATGVSLWLLVFVSRAWKWAGLALLPLPYVYGAPQPAAGHSPVAGGPNAEMLARLHESFVWATSSTNLALWLVLGLGCAWAMQRWISPALADAGLTPLAARA